MEALWAGWQGWGNPVPACGGSRPGEAGPLTFKKLSKNPSRQSPVREKGGQGKSVESSWVFFG